MERLQKIIAKSGVASRRKAEELILAGEVKVNGKVVTTLGTKVSDDDIITVFNKKLVNEENIYYLLNKPRSIISSVSDPYNRETVLNLINDKRRIFPIGRLDYDTTGLILITNDGELANILMHPNNNVEKTYIAKIEGKMSMENLFKLKNGLVIDDKKTVPTIVKIKSYDKEKNTSIIKISLVEGRNHIVKKIFQKIDQPVIKLKRETYGFLTLGDLKSGEYRKLTKSEVKKLYEYKK